MPVTTALVRQGDFPIELRAVGAVEASATVNVKSIIGGELVGVHFEEGQDVGKGQLLFTIDPRPHEAALREAKARLDRNAALLHKAEEDYRRYEELLSQGIVSREQFDQIFSTLASLKASVRADEASVESARVQLDYAFIHAPIAGRAGRLRAHKGNIIKANADDPLVDVVAMEPVHVSFAVPEERLAEVLRAMRTGEVSVIALPAARGASPEVGRLFFVDNLVDRQTGTITLKAEFRNENRMLWPGQFASVSVRLGEVRDALIAPARAVQTGLDNQYVWVVDASGVAQIKTVVTGLSSENETVLVSGVSVGERVVTDGQLRLTPGAAVDVRDEAPAPDFAPEPGASAGSAS
ncbi:efflux transporter, RND family, MFP subunit [Alkalidesulfovibrio alkalitolerans DSM 16529]|uniref:Efflux transporter, RND family, MFP subunit n=1 Tax=Alkalidesulfovibrio alkalitolerans DSM 16529 TaxID=1121439 RepID=S7TCR4_9BACT|nr:efflux RND transporter periplasmic adaptor subunit [Alkalidesulfovibrio alkalitolerans]EPR34315.1 efflux transporter, RND family, MFP subunit [Alkalidesulfovibrio alkalitolerans DSM 16529]